MNEPTPIPSAPVVPSWQPIRGPFQRWPRMADFLLAVYAFFMTMAMWSPDFERGSISPEMAAGGLATFICVLVGNFAIYWRRSKPVLVHGIVVAASVLGLIGQMNNNVFAMAFSLYSLGRYADDDRASYLGMGASLLLVLADLFLPSRPDGGSIIAAMMVMGLWYIGRRLRFRGEYLRLLEERAEDLERQKLGDAERAVAEERTRIARELHDIVAHQVSLMTVQAGAAKTVAKKDPEAAIEAMGSVEQAGRQALDELRHLLGVLRPDKAAPGLGPQPGCADLPRLVEDLNEAGLELNLTMEGIRAELPARVDLAVYRIVQEALTNVLKHAGPGTRAEVTISASHRGIELNVRDHGRGSTLLPGSGIGITGMRERAQLLSGSHSAGPLPEGGFLVRAFLPLSEDSG